MSLQVLEELASSVEEMDPDKVMVLSKRAVDAGINPADIVENGIAKGLRRVGERFEKGEARDRQRICQEKDTRSTQAARWWGSCDRAMG